MLVHFAGGKRERADLLVGGDGIRSSVREQVAPAVQPVYSGYYIWRGAPKEADLAEATRASIFPYFTFFLPERQQVIGYPIAGLNNDLRVGHRRYNFIWYRVADAQELRRMCVDEDGRQHAHSVPPPLIRNDLIAQMRAEARAIMPPQFLDCLPHASLLHADLRLLDPAHWCSDAWRWWAMPPPRASAHGLWHGQGGRRRPGARRRARLQDNIDAGLAAYNRARQPIGERIVLHGRRLGTHLGSICRARKIARCGSCCRITAP